MYRLKKFLDAVTGLIFFENDVYLKQVSLRVSNSIGKSPIKIFSLSLVILQDLSKEAQKFL